MIAGVILRLITIRMPRSLKHNTAKAEVLTRLTYSADEINRLILDLLKAAW